MSLSDRDIWKRRWFLDGGDLMPAISAYIDRKRELGHKPRSIRLLSAAARHFGCWIKSIGVNAENVTQDHVTEFATHDCSCPGGRRDQPLQHNYVLSVRAFVRFLHQMDGGSSHPDPFDVEGYCRWCAEQRGLTENTIAVNRKLLNYLLPKAPKDLRDSTAAEVRDYIISLAPDYATSTLNTAAASIRRYLRYNRIIGRTVTDNYKAIPRFASWKAADIPKYLEPSDLQTLLDALDDTTSLRARDKAIILTIAALGLRPSDISKMRMGDIDWRNGTVRVSGKGRREIDLPLPQEAGDAIRGYVDHHRVDGGEFLFQKMIAPFDKPLSVDAVSLAVRNAVIRAGLLNAPIKGAYLLRHTAATEMIRKGASLEAVSSVLRHKLITTTTTYAKIDHAMLRSVAQPWPGAAVHA